jgi:hypothetical protein
MTAIAWLILVEASYRHWLERRPILMRARVSDATMRRLFAFEVAGVI